jgi:2-keto-4-pentenoate hydratase/2-oxohepta-3-ene-1,7-dioic acid hydratase in catechol pathway
MKIIRYQAPTGATLGIVEGDTVYHAEGDMATGFQPGRPIGTLHGLSEGPCEIVARPAVQLDQPATLPDFALLSPCAPTKIVALGRNYAAHAAEHGAQVPSRPLIFLKPPSAVIGPGEAIVCPPQSAQVEYEAELAVVVGRRARHVAAADVWDYILGYTCANDVTARDLQRSDEQWSRAKGFDTFAPLGPWIVTGLDPARLSVTCRVNGQIVQHGSTADMVFKIPTLVEFISAAMTLEPGDVILTGTPEGVGPIQAGDRVEVEIEGIGALCNPVIAG